MSELSIELLSMREAIQIRWASSDLAILETHPLTPGLIPTERVLASNYTGLIPPLEPNTRTKQQFLSDQGALTEATRTYDATPICVVSESSVILPTCSAPTEAVAGEPTEAPPPDKWLTSSQRGGTTVEAHHFVAAVLPTLLAVLFAIPFHIIHLHAASLEPFHQLTVSSRRRDGATLSRSLLADYTSFSALSALVPGLTFTLVYAAAILAPLAAEAWEIALFGTCAADESDGCVPVMRAIPQLVRALEGVLAFVVILAGLLVLALRNWTPGVMADPRSVLGIAALAHEQGVAELFRQLRGDGVGLKEMKTRVGGLRAALGTFVAPAGHVFSGLLFSEMLSYSPLFSRYHGPDHRLPTIRFCFRTPVTHTATLSEAYAAATCFWPLYLWLRYPATYFLFC
ncbi:hypothetical protein VTI28DRAFT_6233 [Corynascus sepedonium]